jgi:NADH-quinone oxidoreductase subunit F
MDYQYLSNMPLDQVKADYLAANGKYKHVVRICYGAGCVSSECADVKDAVVKAIAEEKLTESIKINLTGCMGACTLGPTIIVDPEGILYCNITPDIAVAIVKKHLKEGTVLEKYCYKDKATGKAIPHLKDIAFFKRQQKIVLARCGDIDFSSLDEYISRDGYFALAKVLKEMSQEAVIAELKKSGLRGRGGGGFPTGVKWEGAYKQKSDQKYIICNADEGDPGAFMDRSLLEGDSHSVIEGMAIGGYAIGATKGVIYIRAEYPLAVERRGTRRRRSGAWCSPCRRGAGPPGPRS